MIDLAYQVDKELIGDLSLLQIYVFGKVQRKRFCVPKKGWLLSIIYSVKWKGRIVQKIYWGIWAIIGYLYGWGLLFWKTIQLESQILTFSIVRNINCYFTKKGVQ